MKFTSAELTPGPLAETTASSISANEKHKMLYVVFVIAFTCLSCYFFGSMMQVGSSALSAIIFAAIFLCVGIIHIFIFPQWMPPIKESGFNMNMLYAIVIAVCISLSSLIMFWSNQFHLKTLWLVSGVAFLLPVLAMECFQLFSTLPASQYEPWYLQADIVPEKKMSLLLNSTLFKVHLLMKPTDDKPVLFNMTLPKKLTVGTAFSYFFFDHQKTIELTENNRPYGWLFFVKTWRGIKMLDPLLSLAQNKIKEGDIIYARRVSA